MSRRCARECVEWYRRKDRGEDPIGDPLAEREASHFLADARRDPRIAAEMIRWSNAYGVGAHLREDARLP